jgi:hypothetical protein
MKIVGTTGVPSNATAVLLNVTVADAIGRGWVQVYPTGRAVPGSSSNLNVPGPGANIPNLVLVPVGSGGMVTFVTQGGGHLIADLLGYFTPSGETKDGRFEALGAPIRTLDTRMAGFSRIPDRGTLRLPVTSKASARAVVPDDASAVVVNLTATDARADGYLQAYPTDQRQLKATSSNLNFRPHEPAPNLAIVPIGADGSITLYAHRSVHVVADVIGYFTSGTASMSDEGLFVPFGPRRLVDSRRTGGALPRGGQRHLDLVGIAGLDPGNVGALVLNATLVSSRGAGWMQLIPKGRGTPGASSNVNVSYAGATRPNATISGVANGRVTVVHHAGGHFVLDAAGYFTS